MIPLVAMMQIFNTTATLSSFSIVGANVGMVTGLLVKSKEAPLSSRSSIETAYVSTCMSDS